MDGWREGQMKREREWCRGRNKVFSKQSKSGLPAFIQSPKAPNLTKCSLESGAQKKTNN